MSDMQGLTDTSHPHLLTQRLPQYHQGHRERHPRLLLFLVIRIHHKYLTHQCVLRELVLETMQVYAAFAAIMAIVLRAHARARNMAPKSLHLQLVGRLDILLMD